MDLLNHDLAHEFPRQLEKMRELKRSDAHFAKLFHEYDEDNHAINLYDLGSAVISEDALEGIKKSAEYQRSDLSALVATLRSLDCA